MPSGKTGRYAMVRATLTGNGTDSPTLSDIQLTCNSASDTGSRVIRYRYDEAGNILKITTIDDLGVSDDVRDDAGWSSGERLNSLSQIMRQDVGGDTWTFSYDLNGNMTGKTNGVDTWTDTWDSMGGNRLVRVQGPGSVDIAYAYDYAGRMVSRDDGEPDITYLTWDGFDCIHETTGMSTTTYCIPEGVLTSFIRDGDRFDVHTDALMSVRVVTDEYGDVVLRTDFDAWGRALNGSFDNVPGGFAYAFVGALGVRYDSATGLYYMRHRWYDPTLKRFISRDPSGLKGGINSYAYVASNPLGVIDPHGLDGVDVCMGMLDGLGSIASGFLIGAIILAALPELLAFGALGVVTAVGGFGVGGRIYELATGEEYTLDGTGRKLTPVELDYIKGELIMDAASFAIMAHPWTRRGGESDGDFLKKTPWDRMWDDMGKVTTSEAAYKKLEGIEPQKRRGTLRHIDWSQLKHTWGTGATSGIRMGCGPRNPITSWWYVFFGPDECKKKKKKKHFRISWENEKTGERYTDEWDEWVEE